MTTPPEPPAPTTLRAARIWPWLFGAFGMLVMFAPTLASGFARMQHDPGDTRLICYVVEHVLQALLHPGTVSFWSPPVFFPERDTLAYSDVLLGMVPFYAPFRALGLEPLSAFQGMQLTAAAVNMTGGYWLLRRHARASRFACAVGAFLIAFGSPSLAMVKHPQFFPRVYLLVAIDGLLSLGTGRAETVRARWLAAAELVFGMVLQLWTAVYLAVFLVLLALLAVAWALVLPSTRAALGRRIRELWRSALASCAAIAVLCVPLGLHYLRASAATGGRQWAEIEPGLPRPISWLYLGPANPWYLRLAALPSVRALPLPWEHAAGVGLLTLVVVLAGFWLAHRERMFLLLGVSVLTAVALVTAWEPGSSAWGALFRIAPALGVVRVMVRISLVLLVPLGFALTHALDRVSRPALAFALGIACALEQVSAMPSFDKVETQARVERIIHATPSACRTLFYLALQPSGFGYACQTDAMWAAHDAGIATVNGYSGAQPTGWDLQDCALTSEQDRARQERALATWLEAHRVPMGEVCVVAVEGQR